MANLDLPELGLKGAPGKLDAAPPADVAATADLEDAVLQCILAERSITAAAARVGRSRAELERLAAAYRQHGAAALT